MRRRRTAELRLLLHGLLEQKAMLSIGLVLVLVGSVTTWMEPRVLAWLIDEGLVAHNRERLDFWLAILAVTLALRVLATVLQSYCSEVIGQRLSHALRQRVYERILRLPLERLSQETAGRWMTRATHDVSAIAEMFSSGMISIVSQILTVVGVLVWIIALSPRLGLLASSVFPILVAATFYFSGRLQKSYRESRAKLASLNSFLAESLMGVRTLQLFNRVDRALERLTRLNQWYTTAQFEGVRIYALFQPLITLATGVAVGITLWTGARASRAGEIPVGILVAYFAYVMALFQPLRELADKWNVFLSGFASLERLVEVLALPVERERPRPQAQKAPDRDQVPSGSGQSLSVLGGVAIEFKNVWFAYKSDAWVLKDFSAKIPAGRSVGVVGHTGSGKSTLVGLLLRFYEPQKGRILLDGRDIQDWPLAELRRVFGFIQQDDGQFSGTSYDNVTFWGAIEKDRGEVNRALSQLGVSDPDLLHSAGEKQVVAFARAWVASPKVYILDEATAHLDSTTENRVMEFLIREAKGRTVISIAHRLSTVQNSDEIWVIHHGQLAEKGTHAELLAMNGLYTRLQKFQWLGGPGTSQTV